MRHRSSQPVQLGVGDAVLEGELTLDPEVTELVLLVNGDWGVRYATRESEIAKRLEGEGFGTLLIELLTPEEGADRANRFATERLADRLAGVIAWLDGQERTTDLDICLFGIGPGAATALHAAELLGAGIGAIVTLDGRLDLVDALDEMTVPTLLVTEGSNDHLVLVNQQAYRTLDGEQHQHLILHSEDGGSEGVSDEAASLATNWFRTHLTDEA